MPTTRMHPMDAMTDCPSLGTLRAHLDHDDVAVAHHLDACRECRATILTVAATAGATRRLLDLLDEPGEEPGAVEGSGAAAATTSPPPGTPRPGSPRPGSPRPGSPRPGSLRLDGRGDASGPGTTQRHRSGVPSARRSWLVAGAVVVAVLAATVGAPVVAQVLDRFRTEQVRAVAIDPARLDEELAALDGLAEVDDVAGETIDGDLGDLAEAAELARVPAPDPAVLDGLVAPRVRATSRAGVRVAFHDDDVVPARLRGVVVEVVSPGTLLVGDATGSVFVAASRAVEVGSTGASLDDVRETLLTELDLPPDLVERLASIEDWRTTLPVPVPVDLKTWDEVVVAGTRGVAVGQGDELGVVVWQDGDVVHAVGGERGVDELVELAGRL